MRKTLFISFCIAILGLLGIGVVAFASQEDTTESIHHTWSLEATIIDDIYIGGLNQPVHLIIEQGDQTETSVLVSGKVPKRSLESLADPDYTTVSPNELLLSFERWNSGIGTSHININEDKREAVTIHVILDHKSLLKQLRLDNSGGDITVTVSKELALTYKLDAHGYGTVSKTTSVRDAPSLLEVHNYGGDITVKTR
ncbi:hypothetical protein [Streptococcus moroccensis]|uniref:Adhesin domain-containing protein n=1 Tax=Streptococcus moroccensis TaxID=1451356 RepID=A0ABT9YUY6_9STRE|nr:hypothetical protein [Streptococcus moroccensis]MDQ0223143.1 hypothetical protein [Streptococcus moroccensis]